MSIRARSPSERVLVGLRRGSFAARVVPLFVSSVATSLAIALSSTSAAAQPGSASEPVAIAYDADPGCPPVNVFFDQVRARTQRVRRAERDEAALSLRVTARITDSAAIGRLEVQTTSDEVTARAMSAPECDELVAALALVAALSIDPDASMDTSPGAPTPDAGVSAARLEGEQEEPPPSLAPLPRERIAAPASVAAPPRGTWSAGGGGWLHGGALPGVALGGRAWLETAAGDRGTWSPAARLSVGAAATFAVVLGPAKARFQLYTARLDGCPTSLRFGGVVGFEPCLLIEGGALRGEGADVSIPRSATSLWLATGPLGRLKVRIGSHVTVELESGVVVPLSRPTMTFQGDTAYEVPLWGFTAGLGATMTFL